MIFLSIELYKYNRIKDNKLSIEFTGGLHLFIGSNGSGKTSVMSEISVLPSDKNDFEDGGHKIVCLIERGVKYILSSFFDDKPIYSFVKIVNDVNVELNIQGTISIQKDLAMSEFGLNQNMQNVLMRSSESKGFSLMTPQERKNWISTISSIDYDYAMSVHKNVTDKIKASKSVISYLSNISLGIGRIEGNELEFLKRKHSLLSNDIPLYEEILSIIERETGSNVLDKDLFKKSLKGSRELLIRARKLNTKIRADSTYIYSPEKSTQDNLDSHSGELESIENKIGMLNAEKKGLVLFVESGKKNLVFDMDAAKRKINDLSSVIASIVIPDNAIIFKQEYIESIGSMESTLLSIHHDLPTSSTHTYSSKLYWEYESMSETIPIRIKDISVEINLHNRRLSKPELTTCPSCDHSWSDPSEVLRIERASEMCNNLAATKKSLENELEVASKVYEFLCDSKACIDRYKSLMSMFINSEEPSSACLSDRIKGESILDSEAKIVSLMAEIKKDSNRFHRKEKAKKDLLIINTAVSENESFNNAELHVSIERLSEITDKISFYETYRNKLFKSKEDLIDLNNTEIGLYKNVEIVDDNIDLIAIDAIKKDLLKLWQEVSNSLATATAELAEITKELEANERSETEAFKNNKALESERLKLGDFIIIEENLSPKTGLIGEAINGFVSTLVCDINKTVSSVWGDPFVIKSPDTDHDEGFFIDYKFPLITGGANSKEKSDIKLGSKAMREMVDMAFSVIASKLSGIGSFPIYLDEFAHSLDDAHVQNSVDCITELVTSSDSQVFISSHNHLLYAALPHTEVTALCFENLNNDGLNSNINRTTTFE